MAPWLIGISVFFSFAAVSLSVYGFMSSSHKLDVSALPSALEKASEEIMRTSTRRIRELEADWENMYQKFMRLLGRADKVKGLESPKEPVQTVAPALTRADILRRGRNK